MHPDTRNISEHMKDFGLHVFGRSIVDVVFSEWSSPYAHAMGVVRCAHAAEILIKARIAEEHPLLIFEKLPKPRSSEAKLLDVDALLTEGRTIMYSDLPDALWAATGYKIKNLDIFHDFGKLRNRITHFALPDINFSEETLKFGFSVVEPFVRDFWQIDAVDFVEAYDFECEEYLLEQLKINQIEFVRFTPKRVAAS